MHDSKTIFITSFHNLASRILQTDIVTLLLKKGFTIYIFCYDYKKEYFEKEFTQDNVEIIGINEYPMNKFESIMKRLSSSLLPTSTVIINRRWRYSKDKNLISFLISMFLLYTFARVKLLYRIYRKLFYRFYNREIFKDYFNRYKPDVIFSSDIFHNEDIRLIAEARKKGISALGMVRSWDNLTSRSIMQIDPDKMIVHNEIIKEQAIKLHKYDKNKITISGVPQFDEYINYQPKLTREEFLNKLDFEERRKIIIFAPTGKKFIKSDWMELQILHDAILEGKIKGNPQIIVRYPPGDIMDIEKVKISDKVKVYIDKPGVDFKKKRMKDREMSRQDMDWLGDNLYYTDLLISAGSTLCVDIVAFDKPIVCPKFDGDKNIEYFDSVLKMYDKHHYRYLVRTSGGKLVYNKDEFIHWINKYLDDPTIDRDKRKVLLTEQYWKHDGASCERIVNFIIENIK